jgi:hypothetical protein
MWASRRQPTTSARLFIKLQHPPAKFFRLKSQRAGVKGFGHFPQGLRPARRSKNLFRVAAGQGSIRAIATQKVNWKFPD